jgi:hypothetical protein
MKDYKQCPYKSDCQRYGNERIVCTFLYNVCFYKKRIDEVREGRRVADLAEVLLRNSSVSQSSTEHLRKLAGQDK